MVRIKTFFCEDVSSWDGREFTERLDEWFDLHEGRIDVLEMIPQTVCQHSTGQSTKSTYTLTIKYRIINFEYEFFNRGEKIK